MFARVYFFQFADAFNWPFFQGVASDGIHCIGGIDDDSSVVENVYNALDIIGVVVFVIEFEYHGYTVF